MTKSERDLLARIREAAAELGRHSREATKAREGLYRLLRRGRDLKLSLRVLGTAAGMSNVRVHQITQESGS